ncbi:MAG: aldose 1-epimerase [Bryobacteraceae bacterium]
MKSLNAVLLLIPMLVQAADYSARKVTVDSIEVVRLSDGARGIEVSIVPSIGNNAYQMVANGKDFFWSPFKSLADFKAKPANCGNPFLAPWANRLDQDAFFANGKKFSLNPELGNLPRDPNGRPIHGLLRFAPWEVVSMKADASGAEVTSRFEFWRYPELMAQFPFAHTLEMTYRLKDGALEVETAIKNHSTEPMPVAIGYHPYFRLHDTPRDAWKVHLAAREHLMLSEQLIPTGERKPNPFPDPVSLSQTSLDDVFTGLVRDASGRATFFVEGGKEKLSVVYGPKYSVAVVYAPSGRDFICFEPMAAITNAFNLAHSGVYKELQSIAPGGEWRESFWIIPAGY